MALAGLPKNMGRTTMLLIFAMTSSADRASTLLFCSEQWCQCCGSLCRYATERSISMAFNLISVCATDMTKSEWYVRVLSPLNLHLYRPNATLTDRCGPNRIRVWYRQRSRQETINSHHAFLIATSNPCKCWIFCGQIFPFWALVHQTHCLCSAFSGNVCDRQKQQWRRPRHVQRLFAMIRNARDLLTFCGIESPSWRHNFLNNFYSIN